MVIKQIGIFPFSSKAKDNRLFQSLEMVFPICFVDMEHSDPEGLDGAIFLESSHQRLTDMASRGIPCYQVADPKDQQANTNGGTVHFSDSNILDYRFRKQSLEHEKFISFLPLPIQEEDVVLASKAGNPIWITRRHCKSRIDTVAVPLPELDEKECLRDHFKKIRFIALLPLIHFLRELTQDRAWNPPPLRALFMIDDPNLHGLSYGYVRYPKLAAHAETHNYHIAMAMVPLDGWWIYPPAARLFREKKDQLSLLIHGNNHTHFELESTCSAEQSHRYLAQALRRIMSFEKRSGVPVSRVMAAPYGRCSEQSMRDMLSLSFEAISISRPFPWYTTLEHPYTPPDQPLAGWTIGDLVAGGFPVIPRFDIHIPNEEIRLQAFLNRPLILCGHHDDLASGMDLLAQQAAIINSVGPVVWTSAEEIARSNYETRREGNIFRILTYSRRIHVTIPDEVDQIIVETPKVHGNPLQEIVQWEGNQVNLQYSSSMGCSEPIPVRNSKSIEIFIRHSLATDPNQIPSPPLRLWPIIRRLATEGRDRIAPIIGKK